MGISLLSDEIFWARKGRKRGVMRFLSSKYRRRKGLVIGNSW